MEPYTLKIGMHSPKYPIFQGAMGVGVSLANLAAAVANAGGVGVISGIQLGFREDNFWSRSLEANLNGLRKEIRKARELSPKGVIGINFLSAMQQYKEMVEVAVEEKIDFIISGAGLPVDLPKFIANTMTEAIPIVSSGKALGVIVKMWKKRYDYLPPAVIVEGPKAGGHLGFSKEELAQGDNRPRLEDLVAEVRKAIDVLEEKYRKKIALIAAGGIFDGRDVKEAMDWGADGVQVGTRFVATEECDVDPKFKDLYVACGPEHVEIIQSPVGMPGRAIRTPLIESLYHGRVPITRCMNCLKPCEPKVAPYCISSALIAAANGDVEKGLFFAGENAFKVNKIESVQSVMDDLVQYL